MGFWGKITCFLSQNPYFMSSNKFRVVIPTNADEFLILINSVIAKEESLAPNGTLSAAELQRLKDLYTVANKANAEKKELERKAEERTRDRDNAFGRAKGQGVDTPDTCEFFVTQLRDLVLARNKTNPKVLGEWGFDVDDSPRAGDEPTPPAP